MENKSTSSQLPTALRLGNTVTTDKSNLISELVNFRAGHGCTSATLKVLNDIITTIRDITVQPYSSPWPRLSPLSITPFLLVTSTGLGSQMSVSAGLPTTSLIEFRVLNRRACCPDLWQSLWVCHRFQSRADSLFCIHQWCCSCCWWFSDPPLRRRHHSVYLWPLLGHCVN